MQQKANSKQLKNKTLFMFVHHETYTREKCAKGEELLSF